MIETYIETDTIIYAVSWVFIYIGIPFWFIVAPVLSKKYKFIPNRKLGQGILTCTLIMWPIMLMHRTNIEVPYNMARTEDPMYDGVGGNAVLLIFGWLMALIFQVPHILLRLLIDYVNGKRHRGLKKP